MCDGFLYKDKNVVVIGEGDYALSEADALSRVTNNVTMLTNGREIRSENEDISFIDKRIASFEENDGRIESINFDDNSKINIDGVFLAEGTASSNDLAKKLGVEIENNNIKVDENMKTNILGVFACGDCTGGLKQISKAVYEGMKAGISAIDFLKKV